MRAFYNEIDRYCCDWLQNLMDAGHITPGKIDDRPIQELSPDDVRGYERCHFFAGIAGWELALKMSCYTGPVWTGSCPCQPFSAAGRGKASGDERHLWPEWFRLIRAVCPPVIFGEQVEAAIGWGWLDLVHSDMEPEGYTIRSSVLPACGVGAPHRRDRLWFAADANGGNASAERQQRSGQQRLKQKDGGFMLMGHPDEPGSQGRGVNSREHSGECSPWSPSSLVWLPCTDGKQRPTQPGIFPLVDGSAYRMGSGSPLEGKSRVKMLRAAGNCIVPQVAAEFIKASMA